MEDGLIVPIALFAMIAAIVILPRYFKNKERHEMQLTLRNAIDKGQPLPPEVIDAISKDTKPRRMSSARSDLRAGVIWLAVGLGVAFFGYMIGVEHGEATWPIIGLSAIPIFIGLALMGLGLIDRNRPSIDEA